MTRIKKPAIYLALAFAAFYLFTKPASAADAVNGIFDGILAGADRLSVFFTNVLT
ncbi:hypothetical protein [Nonomuraea phyllanthi]|uniref:hypothetical protein n=1 Tax=Nonomuraea phyllanthi TaxID=2219224 RepID=UPI00186AEE47|nr:hypothetical protein [Nonomuraea phyllanthi]